MNIINSRFIAIAIPAVVGASWALFNIGRLAIQQLQRFKKPKSESESESKSESESEKTNK
jgi:hypothetical protein